MTHILCPTDRYVLLKQGQPFRTSNDVYEVVSPLWGADIRDTYCLLDYEKAIPVTCPCLNHYYVLLGVWPDRGEICSGCGGRENAQPAPPPGGEVNHG